MTRKSWVDGDSFTFLNTKLKNNNYSTKIINNIFALRAYNLFLSFGLFIDPVQLKMWPFNIQPVSRIKLKQTKCREIFFYRCKRRQDWKTITERDVVFRQRAIFNDSFGESRGYSSFSCDLPDNFWGNPCCLGNRINKPRTEIRSSIWGMLKQIGIPARDASQDIFYKPYGNKEVCSILRWKYVFHFVTVFISLLSRKAGFYWKL